MQRKGWTLLVVCVGTFMLLLDITIVNVALPKIAIELKASFSDIQWVIDAYALTLASVLLTTGALADLFGRRLVFAIGLGLFAFTSLLCALSPSALFLILARAGQGIGGAIMFSTSLALLVQEFHGKERGMALGVWGATIGGAAAVGPLLGGVLTEGFGWASIFYTNVPIGIAAAVLTMTKIAESSDPAGTRIDWIGTVTFTGALFLLVLAIIRGNSEGWGSTLIVALFAASIVLLATFLVAQFVQDNAMLDVSLFRKPTFGGASIVAFALSSSMFAMFLYLTLYLQTILGLSPLQTGLRFLPVTVLSFFVAGLSGNLSSRVPVRLLLSLGLMLVAGGLLLMRGLTGTSVLDCAAGRVRRRRRGDRSGQPGARLDRGRRGTTAAQRHGLRDQLDLPPSRGRHRNRDPRRNLRERDLVQAGPEAGRHPRGGPHLTARARDRGRRHAGGGPRHPARAARSGQRRDPQRVRRRDERHPAGRRDRRPGRSGPRPRARARQ